MRQPLISMCLIGAMALGAAMSAWPSHRHRENGGIPGQFDFYLLSLSWSPAFCQQSPRAEECNGPRRYGSTSAAGPNFAAALSCRATWLKGYRT